MPSLIWIPPDGSSDPYLLPPVRYTDGKMYLKIGGHPMDLVLSSITDIKAWFRTDGGPDARDFSIDQVATLMPDLRYESVSLGNLCDGVHAVGDTAHLSSDRSYLGADRGQWGGGETRDGRLDRG